MDSDRASEPAMGRQIVMFARLEPSCYHPRARAHFLKESMHCGIAFRPRQCVAP